MRKVYLGNFVDYKPAEIDYDYGLIGAHLAVSYERERLARTKGLEYYTKDEDDVNRIVQNPTTLERTLARIRYIFTLDKAQVVGYRSYSRTSDLLSGDYSLGKKYDDENNKWVVDNEYYESKGYKDGKKIDTKTGQERVVKKYSEDGEVEF